MQNRLHIYHPKRCMESSTLTHFQHKSDDFTFSGKTDVCWKSGLSFRMYCLFFIVLFQNCTVKTVQAAENERFFCRSASVRTVTDDGVINQRFHSWKISTPVSLLWTMRHFLNRENLESSINLTCMFLDGGRKPEYPERTHTISWYCMQTNDYHNHSFFV